MEQEMPDYETIRAAVAGEKWALEKVLDCYGDEINRLAMVKIHGRIDCLQIGHQGFQVLVGDVLAGITELMDDAVLDFRLGKYRFNCRRESSQIVRTGDENILHATVFEPIEYSSPEFGALVFTDPHAQNIFLSVQINADGNVNSFLHDLAFAANMIVDRVQKHHRVDGLQWSLLPFFRDGQDLVCDPAHGGIRDLHAVDVTYMGLYVSGSHALGVHRQNLFFYVLTDAGLVFLEHHGSNSPLRSRGTEISTSPKLVRSVLPLWPFRLLSVSLLR